MFEFHINGLGWIVVGLAFGAVLSAGYLIGFYDAKKLIAEHLERCFRHD